MKPTSSSSKPFGYPPSPTDRAESSARTASHEPGRTSSPDKAGTSKSRFGTSFNPSRLASGFTKLFGANTEAKEQLKQSARKILDHMEKNLKEDKKMNLNEKEQKELNSFLRQKLTADEMEKLVHAFEGLEKSRESKLKNCRSALSTETAEFVSKKKPKADLMSTLEKVSRSVEIFEEQTLETLVRNQLTRLEQLDKSQNKDIFGKEEKTYYGELQPKRYSVDGQPFVKKNSATYLLELKKFSAQLESQISMLEASSRESQPQSPPRSRPSPQQPESGLPPRRPQFSPRPEPETRTEKASTADEYAGPKISIIKVQNTGVKEAHELAKTLKEHFSEAPLKELHSDLLALAINAKDETKHAFNEKYKKVFETKYDDNPKGFSVLGKAGLSGCGGHANTSKLWSVASAHI